VQRGVGTASAGSGRSSPGIQRLARRLRTPATHASAPTSKQKPVGSQLTQPRSIVLLRGLPEM
jgi:hypothetical protein